jgi:hypothetical protein
MSVSQPNYITKADLKTELRDLRKDLREDLREDFRLFTQILRDELDNRFAAQEARFDKKLDVLESRLTINLKRHTEEVVGRHGAELLENIASIVQPLEKRTSRLEAKVFGA